MMIALINAITDLLSMAKPKPATIDMQCAEVDYRSVDCNYDNDYYGDRHCHSNCR